VLLALTETSTNFR